MALISRGVLCARREEHPEAQRCRIGRADLREREFLLHTSVRGNSALCWGHMEK